MKESEIQKQILDYLAILEIKKKCYYTRTGSGAVVTQRKDGSKGFFKTGRAGTPDIIACFNGFFVGIEVKTEKGKTSKDQDINCNLISQANGIYLVVKSIKELEQDLKTLKLI